jgi:hypothetical protein
MLLVIGQSGSGKTTTLTKAALRLTTDRNISVFVLDEATRERIKDIVKYIGTTSNHASSVLFINNIILFADELLEIEATLRENGVYIIAQCRVRDWGAQLNRFAPRSTVIVNLPHLDDSDFGRLRDGIVNYGIAPKFLNIEERPKQIAVLKRSNRQLLILMIEATEQRKFEETIEDEFRSVEDVNARAAFCVVLIGNAREVDHYYWRVAKYFDIYR